MISLLSLRRNLYAVFRIAHNDTFSFEVHYSRRVYRVTIEPTRDMYKQPSWPRKPKQRKGKVLMAMDTCKVCRNVMAGGLCVDKSCSSNNAEHSSVATTVR